MPIHYTHNCSTCVFIGNITFNNKVYDVYRCPDSQYTSTWIARDSDAIGGYWSMPYNVLSNLTEEQKHLASPLCLLMQKMAIEYEKNNAR